jgi:hypothetical protein
MLRELKEFKVSNAREAEKAAHRELSFINKLFSKF